MKPNEVRLGIWVKHSNNDIYIDKIKGTPVRIELGDIIRAIEDEEERYYEPIQLTDEILIKCGFEVLEVGGEYGTLFGYKVSKFRHFIIIQNPLHPTYFEDYNFEQPIESLRQLQNIIMDLYGKELEVKL